MNRFENFTKPLMWLMALLIATLAAGCGSSSGNSTPSSAKAITAYSLAWTTGTPGSATGIIDQTLKTINVTVPYGTNVNPLFATFTTTGSSVKVGSVTQVNGTTGNDFSNPVAYKVTAADGTWATYTVIITVSASTAKAITTFTLADVSSSPASIGTVITGTVSPFNIAVTMPYGTTDLTALVATFTTTGSTVKVGTTAQTSGTTQNDFTGSDTTPVVYTVTAADASTAIYNVTVTVALSSSKAITAFSLAAASGVPASTTTAITGTASPYDIAVTMPHGTTDLSALVATFTTTGSSVKVGTTVQTSGTSQNDFSAASGVSAVPVAYVVTAADASTATYNVTVNVAATANPTAPTLGEAGRFVILAYAGVTGDSACAISNGDMGITPAARSLMTGFTPSGAAGDYVELTGSTWSGMPSTSYAPADANPSPFPYPLTYAPPHSAWSTTGAMLTQASSDETTAYNFLAFDPNPTAPTTTLVSTELGGSTLTPGVYKTASSVTITTGALNLDAQGDANAVWIFSIDGTLTTIGPTPSGDISFVGGVGSAKNVFWRVAGATSIAANSTFIGNIFDQGTVAVLAGANVTGSLFSAAGSVTLISDTVTKP